MSDSIFTLTIGDTTVTVTDIQLNDHDDNVLIKYYTDNETTDSETIDNALSRLVNDAIRALITECS